jgi:hypothetical protein
MASAAEGGREKTDKKATAKIVAKHDKGESKATKRAISKDEGKKPPREGMGSVGAKMGKGGDWGKKLEGGETEKVHRRPRNT